MAHKRLAHVLLQVSILVTNIRQDVHKIFVDEEVKDEGRGSTYDFYGVDSNIGAAVIVRPDQCKQPYFLATHHLDPNRSRCINGYYN